MMFLYTYKFTCSPATVESEHTAYVPVDGASGEPAMKKVKVVTATQFNSQLLRQQLEQAQRQAEQFKEQLRRKEHEAELYKRQLTEIAGKSTTSQ